MTDSPVPPPPSSSLPLPLNYSVPAVLGPARPFALVAAAGTTVLAGAVMGATTNAVNGAVSPGYFVSVMGWQGVDDVWRASVAQGTLEGSVVGILLAVIFTITLGVVTRATCTYGAALRCLLGIVAAAYACWALGGAVGMGLAALSPDFFRQTFIGVPGDPGLMSRYAWVGGSIWGAEFGGLLSLVVGLVLFRARWRRQASVADRAAHGVDPQPRG